MPTKTLTFRPYDDLGLLVIEPHEDAGSVRLVAEEEMDRAEINLERTQAVAAALHMIACALGEPAALDAERAIAPHMKVSK